MSRSNWAAVAALLAGLAFMAFSGIAVQELGYANAHPYRYGPVKAVGLAAVAGMLLCAALEALAFALGAGRVFRALMTHTPPHEPAASEATGQKPRGASRDPIL